MGKVITNKMGGIFIVEADGVHGVKLRPMNREAEKQLEPLITPTTQSSKRKGKR